MNRKNILYKERATPKQNRSKVSVWYLLSMKEIIFMYSLT